MLGSLSLHLPHTLSFLLSLALFMDSLSLFFFASPVRYRVNWELWISDHMLNVLRACANYAHLQARSYGRGCIYVGKYLSFVFLFLFILSSSYLKCAYFLTLVPPLLSSCLVCLIVHLHVCRYVARWMTKLHCCWRNNQLSDWPN